MQPETLGPYRISRRLGRGGMGTVYAAEAIDSGIEAAVKVLSAPLAREEGFRDRFQAEIETLHKLKHPNIVRLFGFGEEDGVLFYAMELVDGTSLEEELRNHRKFGWREVVQIAVPLCRALRHAHDCGVIHRDIKPANLLLSREGEVKLSDFGIAKLFGASGMTADGGVIGTAEYMSPEQADGRPVTHRCDLYSLGSVMYALCAGRPPFRARSLPEMLHMQRYAEPEPLRTFAPDVPPELEQIIADLLVKDPEHRVPTALVLGRRLESMAHGLSRREQRASQTPIAIELDEHEDFTLQNPDDLNATMAATQGDAQRGDDLDYDLKLDDLDQRPTALGTNVPEPLTAGRADLTVDFGTAAAQVEGPPQAVATPTQTTLGAAPDTAVRTTPASRFMRAEELDQHETAEPSWRISPQTILLAIALAMIGLGIYYFLQPESADRLYQRVSRAAASDQIDELAALSPDIDQFLALYANDRRAPELRRYRAEIELHRLERRFQRRLRSDRNDELLSPIDRNYAEAMRYAEFDPTLGLAKFSALVDLYSGDESLGPLEQKSLELAQRQQARLQEIVNASQERDMAEIDRQLDRADRLQRDDPQQAAAIRRGIIELYRDKAWAQEMIERAQQAQAEVASKAAP